MDRADTIAWRSKSGMSSTNLSSFIWSVADLLRGNYKQSDYGKVILPFSVLRRLDCVLGPTKQTVLQELALRTKAGLNPDPFLRRPPAFSSRRVKSRPAIHPPDAAHDDNRRLRNGNVKVTIRQ